MGRSRGILWLVAGLLVALLAGYVAFQSMSRVAVVPEGESAPGPQVEVVVAARALPVRAVLTAEDVEIRSVPAELAPDGAVKEVADATDKITLSTLVPGEILFLDRLIEPNTVSGDGRLALFMVEDEVLMAVPAQDLLSRVGVLRPGDRLDILFSLDFPVDRIPGDDDVPEEQSTFSVIQNVTVAALALTGGETASGGGVGFGGGDEANAVIPEPDAVLLTLPPQDALVVKYAMDAGGTIDFVLRAPDADQIFDVDPVDVDYLIDRYGIPYEVGR